MATRLTTYLQHFDGGLAAHPTACMKASIVREALLSRPLLETTIRSVPMALREVLREPPLPNAWLPVTYVAGTLLTIADQYGLDDETFVSWRREQYASLLSGPLYRMLFAVVSPEKLVQGAAYKLKSLAKDSLVVDHVETTRGNGEVKLSWPAHLIPPLLARSLMEGVRAALDLARAKNPKVQMRELTTTGASYSLRWG